jgi:hypothetical protein
LNHLNGFEIWHIQGSEGGSVRKAVFRVIAEKYIAESGKVLRVTLEAQAYDLNNAYSAIGSAIRDYPNQLDGYEVTGETIRIYALSMEMH